ncbi:MAG: hypothetical protein AAFR66_07535 [Bacteroidota bacterium]
MNKKWKYGLAAYATLLMEWMAQRVSVQNKNWLDKGIVVILNKLVSTEHLAEDYMADELIASEPAFTIEELEAFENLK